MKVHGEEMMQRGHLVKDLLVRHLPALLRADELAHGVHPPLQLRGAEPPPIVDDALDDGEQLAPGRHSLRESGARERDGGAEGAGPHVLDEPHRALDDGAGVGAEAHRVACRDAECELLPSCRLVRPTSFHFLQRNAVAFPRGEDGRGAC